MKNFKITLFILLFTLSFSLLTGCSRTNNSPAETGVTTSIIDSTLDTGNNSNTNDSSANTESKTPLDNNTTNSSTDNNATTDSSDATNKLDGGMENSDTQPDTNTSESASR